MGRIDYKKLYELQDEVFEIVFRVENIFYLTGGTCLSRFYVEKRYSEDLDFFADASPRYAFAVRRLKVNFLERFRLTVEVEAKDFTRFRINDLLQIDFVNEYAPRHKDVIVTPSGYLIDNVENILTNKLTAIIGRDNPKDVFDIYLIWKLYSFSWVEILDSAHKKAFFSDDELIIRLKTFPTELFDSLETTDPTFVDDFDQDLPKIIEEIRARCAHGV